VAVLAATPRGVEAEAPLRDVPVVWYDDDRRNIPEPQERDPSLVWDGPQSSIIRPLDRFFTPTRIGRQVGAWFGGSDHVRPADNVNTLDEVPNSSWFTNRIGVFPMTPEEVGRGAGEGLGPDQSGQWVIVSAKTQGVTPGFNIKDPHGDVWVIKFDPPQWPNMASAAGVISNRLFHALGYFVPDDVITFFTRDMLTLKEGVKLKLPTGRKRLMTEEDLENILKDMHTVDGKYRAIASKFLSGRPMGPFDYKGKRKDDANDRIRHEDRRELRGLYVFAAWTNHFDTKQHNTLDMYIEDNGRQYLRHHLIDFASTLGTGAGGPVYRYGYEYTIDVPPFLGRLFALGFHEDAWRRLHRVSGLNEVGTFVSDPFDAREFKPLQPNSAFANVTPRDGYWGAKIVSAFTDDQIRAAVEQGRYENPQATEYMTRVLAERRDIIARAWFDLIAPLEYFVWDGGTVRYRDLGVERGIYPTSPLVYRSRVAAVDSDREAESWRDWVEGTDTLVNLATGSAQAALEEDTSERPFLAVQCQVDRGDGFSGTITAYFSRVSGRLVAMDRQKD
jgi:hypothetical protein